MIAGEESEENFRQLLDNLPLMAWTLDENRRVNYVNDRWMDFTGTTPEDLRAREERFSELIHPDDRQQAKARWIEAVETNSPVEGEIRFRNHRTGAYEWFVIRGIPLKSQVGRAVSWIGMSTNVQSQHTAADLLERRTAELESLFENAPLGLAFLDGEHRFVRINQTLADMNGASIEAHIGHTLREIVPTAAPLVEPLLDEVIRTKQRLVKEIKEDPSRRSGARPDWWLSGYFPINAKKNHGAAIGVYVVDISEQRRLAEDLAVAARKAQIANDLKTAFLANMSHEIRTPLGAILGFSDLLRDPALSETDRLAYLEIIARNGEQLTTLINDILDLSKIEAGEITIETLECSPVRLIEETVGLLSLRAKENGIQIMTRFEGQMPERIGTDPIRFKQILMNLLGNAIKFTRKGEVSLAVAYERSEEKAGFLCIEITDTGIGIAAEQQAKLFKPFTQADPTMTRKFGGTGLGLTLSKRLAELLGGGVELVRSQLGIGSTFRMKVADRMHVASKGGSFSSPSPADVSSLTEAAWRSSSDIENVRVLLVDDAVDNQNLIRRILSRGKAILSIASNGQEAIERALSSDQDVILMDLQMPVMDGYTATQKLRECGYDKPIIALTAHAMQESRAKCMEVGCTDFVAKPIRAKELVEKIAAHARPREPLRN